MSSKNKQGMLPAAHITVSPSSSVSGKLPLSEKQNYSSMLNTFLIICIDSTIHAHLKRKSQHKYEQI